MLLFPLQHSQHKRRWVCSHWSRQETAGHCPGGTTRLYKKSMEYDSYWAQFVLSFVWLFCLVCWFQIRVPLPAENLQLFPEGPHSAAPQLLSGEALMLHTTLSMCSVAWLQVCLHWLVSQGADGEVVVEGFLNISWGVRRPIRLKIQDDKQMLPFVPLMPPEPVSPDSPVSPLGDKRSVLKPSSLKCLLSCSGL